VIQARNAGDSPFEVVDLQIMNDPDGVFAIDATTIAPGLVMQPSEPREITVSFDPKEEKAYYSPDPATIRLSYKIELGDEDSTGYVEAPLEGIGIESYVTIGDQSFGRIEFQGAGVNTVASNVVITAEGTRPVNIDQVVVNPNTQFEFDPTWLAANAWATAGGTTLQLDPDGIVAPKTQTVDLVFVPKDTNPLDKRATIDVIGDFADDACSITDSVGNLDGQVFSLAADIQGFDFGSVLTCYERDGYITVRNLSTDPVQITAISPVRPAGPFTVNTTGAMITIPHVLQPSGDASGLDAVQIPVHFAPNGAATYNATVDVTVWNIDSTREIAVLTANLTGVARTMTVNMTIDKNFTQFPGLPLSIPVKLDDDPSEARVTDFVINLDYDDGMMLLNDVKLGTLFPASEGWVLEIVDKRPGALTVRIYNTAGRFVQGTGEALVLDYITFIGDVTETDIPFNVTLSAWGANQNPCITFTTTPGAAALDEVCGLNFRLIRAIEGSKYSVGQAVPSIASSSTEIEF
jgi:hypothetical protein